MSFKKGEDPNRAKGGKRPGAGRKSNIEKEFLKITTARLEKKLEAAADKVIASYLKLAEGYEETRYSDGGMAYKIWIVDAPTTRHALDKFIPAARQQIDLTSGGERFYNITNTFDANARWRAEQKKTPKG